MSAIDVGIIMGSRSDWETMRHAAETLDALGVALYAWTWIGETVAHALFFEGAGVALASFLAMGAFAVPAMLRLRVTELRR